MQEVNEQNIYEVGYHILPSVSESNISSEVEKIKSYLGSSEIISEEAPEMINLAYSISKKSETKNNHYDKAYFGWVKFVVDKEEIASIATKLDTNPNILRYIIVKTVRENTIHTPKSLKKDRVEDVDGEIKDIDVAAESLPVVSEQELDKTIEDLVIS